MKHSYVIISVKSSLILVKFKKKDVNKVQLTTKLQPPSDDVNHKKCARIRELKQNGTQIQVK